LLPELWQLEAVGSAQRQSFQEIQMADGSGASGLLGVLLGALLVVFIGAAFLMYGGNFFPQRTSTFTIQLPK
jgi:hypothetical protein